MARHLDVTQAVPRRRKRNLNLSGSVGPDVAALAAEAPAGPIADDVRREVAGPVGPDAVALMAELTLAERLFEAVRVAEEALLRRKLIQE